jgi:uncharacterized protein YkwD
MIRLYMPLIMALADSQPAGLCGMSPAELAVFGMLAAHPDQRRQGLDCHTILVQAARQKAAGMASLGYFGHTAPDGETPNMLIRRLGYVLPEWYGDNNGVESLGAGYADPGAAWLGWMNSPGHRAHLLGSNAFWADQRFVGVGHVRVEGSPFVNYWAVITAP